MTVNNTVIFIFFLLANAINETQSQLVKLGDAGFEINGTSFTPIVLNYDIQLRFKRTDGDKKELYLTPAHSYFTTPDKKVRCANPADCSQMLNDHFAEISAMGFNTIRIVGHYTYSVHELAGYPSMWAVGDHWGDRHFPQLEPPFTDNFRLIEEILTLSQKHNLKVILLTGGKRVDERLHRNGYAEYLEALAARFANDPRLLAFDLLNEPEYFHSLDVIRDRTGSVTAEIPYSKEQIQQLANMWISAIKSKSSNLLTFGLTGSGTMFQWDPEILNVDFFSFHLYPKPEFENFYDRYLSEVRYWGQSTRKPWIIGETGFSASDLKRGKWLDADGGKKYYPNDGTPEEQDEFVRKTAQMCFDCGGLGYSWWQYHEVHWEPDYGLIDSLHRQKPASGAFADLNKLKADASRCASNAAVVNAQNGKKGSLGRKVVSSDGAGIADAVVMTNIKSGSRGRTFTDERGKFKVRGNGFVNYIMVSAPGYRSRTINRFALLLKPKIKLYPAGCDLRSCRKADCKSYIKTEVKPLRNQKIAEIKADFAQALFSKSEAKILVKKAKKEAKELRKKCLTN